MSAAKRWVVSTWLRLHDRLFDGATQPSRAFIGKPSSLFCRCPLRFDLRGGFCGCECAEFFGFHTGGGCLPMGVAGFALGADEPRSYRVAPHSVGSQLMRE